MSLPLVGNSTTLLSAENALKNHRLPHAVLIDGDIGSGRHTLSGYLCKAIVCSGENNPCGECRNCKLADGGNHPDIAVISPEKDKKSISVGQIRELKGEAFIKPHTANSRVFVISPADTMNEQAQNALLKVLEEPPANTYFILVAESKASLLDTVISRCAVFSLTIPTKTEAKEYIASVTDFESDEISTAVENSGGNIGKALMLLKGRQDTKTATAAKDFVEALLGGNSWEAICAITPFEKSRNDADRLFKDIKLVIADRLKSNPKGVRSANLLRLYNTVSELEYSLETNINLSLLFADLTARAKGILS